MNTEFAPAKINLTLRVGAVREDGYHPIDSLVVFADWGDRLSLKPAADLSLQITGPQAGGIPPGDDNLVLRATRALAKAAGRTATGHLTLDKNIPAGAGIGGGSADAAAALRLFNRLWELDWPLDMLAGIGAEIGSDVPACVWSQPLRMTGRGERIRRIEDWPDFPALLVNPGKSVTTADVFRAFDQMSQNTGTAFRAPEMQTTASLLAALAEATNDLTEPALQTEPAIAQILNALDVTGKPALVRMSGSGATCFALYGSIDDRNYADAQLKSTYPHWHCFPVLLAGATGISTS
ncbi:4-(cytidine 5'-diphospho)-2-C-methyl-D-erythritol kinase [Hyphobacterium sp.]|uniref:4-(cytidine 5'-diphospho)-2-C-methyl-D-erythritol kinase n=1 Tax=Hyphobacterium sp. TaxID=2004662 RepID=UPI003BAD9B56